MRLLLALALVLATAWGLADDTVLWIASDAGELRLGADSDVAASLSRSGPLELFTDGSLVVEGTLSAGGVVADGNATLTYVSGEHAGFASADIGGITIDSSAHLTGAASVAADQVDVGATGLTVSGPVSVTSPSALDLGGSGLAAVGPVAGCTVLEASEVVTAQLNATESAAFMGSVEALAGLTVQGDATLTGGTLSCDALVSGGTLQAAGGQLTVDANGGLSAAELFSVGDTTVQGDASLAGALSVDGASTLAGVSASGAATLSSTLSVAGDSTLTGTLSVADQVTLSSLVEATSAAAAASLWVKGGVAVQKSLFVGNDADVAGTLTAATAAVTGDAGVDGALTAAELVLTPSVKPAGSSIALPSDASVVTVQWQSGTQANVVALPDTPTEGQLLVVHNADDDATTGDLQLTSSEAVLLVYSDGGWVQVGNSDVSATMFERYSASANAPAYYSQRRARGSEASPAAVQDGDALGRLSMYGHDGSQFAEAASVRAVSSNSGGGQLLFATSPTGSNVTQDRLSIGSDGSSTLTAVADEVLALNADIVAAVGAGPTLTLQLAGADAASVATESTSVASGAEAADLVLSTLGAGAMHETLRLSQAASALEHATTATNGVETLLTLRHSTSGTAADGVGSAVAYELENAAGALVAAVTEQATLEAATSGAEEGAWAVHTLSAASGNLTECVKASSAGGVSLMGGAATVTTAVVQLTVPLLGTQRAATVTLDQASHTLASADLLSILVIDATSAGARTITLPADATLVSELGVTTDLAYFDVVVVNKDTTDAATLAAADGSADELGSMSVAASSSAQFRVLFESAAASSEDVLLVRL